MPSGHEGEMYAGGVKIIVHPMIQAAGRDADKVGGVGTADDIVAAGAPRQHQRASCLTE